MPAIDSLMKKLGFVKISQYGLILTPEGRLMSMRRPTVLDDGFGGRIVGWKDGDLAAAELAEVASGKPRVAASPQAVASRVAAPRPPIPTQPLPVVRAPAPPIPVAVGPVAVAIKPPAAPVVVAAPAFVAPAPVVEEDDWEWTIAIARARAAAEEVEVAVTAAQAPQRRMRADTLPPPMIAALPDPIGEDSWPKTQPLGEIDYNDYRSPVAEVVRVVRAQPVPLPLAPVPVPRSSVYVAPPTPSTVIPIPRLATTASSVTSRITPVVRQTLPTPLLPTQPRRFAKGTAPVLPQSTSRIKTPDAPPATAVSEDTVPNISLSPAAAAVRIPSIKRA